MMGQKALDAAIVLIEALKLPMTPQEYLAERNEKHEKLFPNCKLLPGVYELVCHLKRANGNLLSRSLVSQLSTNLHLHHPSSQ